MNNTINQPKRPIGNIIGHPLPSPAQCEHPYKALAHEAGNALKRCVHYRSLEAA